MDRTSKFMTDSYNKLEKLMEFPCVVGFRVIVDASIVNSLGEVEKAINEVEAGIMQKITDEPRKSSKGNYVSYTIPVKVNKAENLKLLYEKISALPCVKHVI
ncbi:MAG: DUF493 domain-containing protein [Succinivibrio dextrinosolvens]|nr:DUF493 domain-containing protein [Succinivibrio dextrinosolvens]